MHTTTSGHIFLLVAAVAVACSPQTKVVDGAGGADGLATGSSSTGSSSTGSKSTAKWSKAFDTTTLQMPFLALAPGGTVLLAGNNSQPVDFGAGPIKSQNLYLAAFSPAGAPLWSRGFGQGFGSEIMQGVVASPHGIVIAGWLRGTVDFGGGPLKAAGKTDVFVAAFPL